MQEKRVADENAEWRPAEVEESKYWLQSYRGHVIPLPSFRNDEAITIVSTARVLAGINRFGARTVGVGSYYNVAHHSVLVARLVRDLGGTVLEQFQALNHEGDESLLGFDPPAPLVRVCPDLARLKRNAHESYCHRYGLPVELPQIVKHADMVLLATEKRDLMAPCAREWLPMPEPLAERIEPWDPARSESIFITEWCKLAVAIGLPEERW